MTNQRHLVLASLATPQGNTETRPIKRRPPEVEVLRASVDAFKRALYLHEPMGWTTATDPAGW